MELEGNELLIKDYKAQIGSLTKDVDVWKKLYDE
jgi:hypothetical protein